MTENKFEVVKDAFGTSAKSLDDLEDSTTWRNIAKEYFNENPEELKNKIECLRIKLQELGIHVINSQLCVNNVFLVDFIYYCHFVDFVIGAIGARFCLFHSPVVVYFDYYMSIFSILSVFVFCQFFLWYSCL